MKSGFLWIRVLFKTFYLKPCVFFFETNALFVTKEELMDQKLGHSEASWVNRWPQKPLVESYW